MVVQHNMTAINANRYFGINNNKLSKSLEKLSSGYAINRAGDNAAGLAVSEKMRSQIAGINQGVKNAQDGISMVQTYEGALTETDSILQRMKTLATQSANGTYQDDVDREAIQLEFNQLNDELNQIADTDFNGVVALNGGQMADGTKAVNGKFDYENGTKAATKLGKNDVNVVDSQLWDNDDVANDAWKALNAQWTRTAGQPATNGPDSVDVTFKYNQADGTWSAINATNGADVAKVSAVKTANGGFGIQIDGNDVANVVIDQSKLGNGDTITLTFNNPANKISAPTNAGAVVSDSTNFTEGTIKVKDADLTVTVDAGVTDDKMTEDIDKLMDLLDGAQFDASYKSKTVSAAGDFKITLKDGTAITGSTAGSEITVGNSKFKFATDATGKLTVTGTVGTTANATILEIQAKAATATDTSVGTISYKIGIEHSKYSDAATPSIDVAKTGNVSRSNSNNAASAPLTYTDNISLQVGARTKDSVNFSFEYASNGLGDLKADLDCSARGLGTDKLSLETQESANAAIDKIDNALNKVSMVRGSFGAVQNRLEHKIDNLNTTSENLTSAESRIRDTNMAEEMMNFTKNQILSQASQSMLAQANQLPQGVLSLLQ